MAGLAAMQMPIVEEGLEKAGPLIEEGAAKVEQEAPVIENEFATLTQKAKDLYPKLANKVYQLHHVIPKYLGGAKDGVLVKIPAAYHQLITNAIRNAAPYGEKIQRSAEQVNEILQKIYQQFPLPPH